MLTKSLARHISTNFFSCSTNLFLECNDEIDDHDYRMTFHLQLHRGFKINQVIYISIL